MNHESTHLELVSISNLVCACMYEFKLVYGFLNQCALNGCIPVAFHLAIQSTDIIEYYYIYI